VSLSCDRLLISERRVMALRRTSSPQRVILVQERPQECCHPGGVHQNRRLLPRKYFQSFIPGLDSF
jgi:hypothetical protein